MKLRHVFSVVIGAHLAVIALLFVTPGCQSGSGGADGAQDNSGGLTASDTAPQYARHARQWQTGPVYTPDSSPASNQLYSPTKPEWNVNENTSAAPVTSSYNDETIEVLQPVRGGAASGQPAAFGELVSITTETGGVDPYAGAGAGSSYTVQKLSLIHI